MTWTVYNRWLPEVVIDEGSIEVSPFAVAAELEVIVRAAVYRVDPLMWAGIETWAIGAWSAL